MSDPKTTTGAFWDRMYDRDDYRYGFEPNAFLAEHIGSRLAPHAEVLSVGDGEGRNGVWLAEQGFRVTAAEPSPIGIRKSMALADERGVALAYVNDRIPSPLVRASSFDAVVLIYVHASPRGRLHLHRAAADALRPGGVLLIEAFTPAQRANDRTSGGPPDPAMLYTQEVLAQDFDDFDVELLEETVTELDEGDGHAGPADVVRLIARKPA